MRLLLINPNTTAAMTADIGESAAAVARADTIVETVNPLTGPAAIENDDDELQSIPGLLAEIDAAANRSALVRPDAYVVACFGDPGLAQARTRALGAPVLGIAQAAMHSATLMAGTFSVVTSMSATVPRGWELAKEYTPHACLGVYACDIPVLTLATDDSSIDVIEPLCRSALDGDGSSSIVLGCAAMARFAEPLRRRLGVPVIDGVVAATLLAEALVPLNG